MHPEYVCRTDARVEFYIISRALPLVGNICQKVVHLIGPVIIKPQFLKGEVYPARLYVLVIQVHNDQYYIGKVIGMFAIGNKLVIIYSVEPEVGIALKSWILPSDPVYPGDKVLQAVTPIDIPELYFILF